MDEQRSIENTIEKIRAGKNDIAKMQSDLRDKKVDLPEVYIPEPDDMPIIEKVVIT